jgi:hypothetical protein
VNRFFSIYENFRVYGKKTTHPYGEEILRADSPGTLAMTKEKEI